MAEVMHEVVVIDAVRTPIGRGRPGGALSHVHPVDLLSHVLRALVDRTGIDPGQVDDVIGGVVLQAGEQGLNATRRGALAAGFPESVPAVTVDRQCGSSQQAVHFAAQGVVAGSYDLAIAVGVESMSRVPMAAAAATTSAWPGHDFSRRYPDGMVSQGVSAELIASKWGISRSAMDELAAQSHHRSAAAADAGMFDDELVPLDDVARDEGVRPDCTIEALAKLPTVFHDDAVAARFGPVDWAVTAGNSSQVSDGAAAVLLASADTAARLGLTPLARVHAITAVGDDPVLKLTGSVPATKRVLEKAGLALKDIDLFEVNEAFASVVLAWLDETGADSSKVNTRGGAIALGHPLGASGARLTATLVHALHQTGGRFGLQTMCEAGGLANATIYERL